MFLDILKKWFLSHRFKRSTSKTKQLNICLHKKFLVGVTCLITIILQNTVTSFLSMWHNVLNKNKCKTLSWQEFAGCVKLVNAGIQFLLRNNDSQPHYELLISLLGMIGTFSEIFQDKTWIANCLRCSWCHVKHLKWRKICRVRLQCIFSFQRTADGKTVSEISFKISILYFGESVKVNLDIRMHIRLRN